MRKTYHEENSRRLLRVVFWYIIHIQACNLTDLDDPSSTAFPLRVLRRVLAVFRSLPNSIIQLCGSRRITSE
jgi:hypothetical protein